MVCLRKYVWTKTSRWPKFSKQGRKVTYPYQKYFLNREGRSPIRIKNNENSVLHMKMILDPFGKCILEVSPLTVGRMREVIAGTHSWYSLMFWLLISKWSMSIYILMQRHLQNIFLGAVGLKMSGEDDAVLMEFFHHFSHSLVGEALTISSPPRHLCTRTTFALCTLWIKQKFSPWDSLCSLVIHSTLWRPQGHGNLGTL